MGCGRPVSQSAASACELLLLLLLLLPQQPPPPPSPSPFACLRLRLRDNTVACIPLKWQHRGHNQSQSSTSPATAMASNQCVTCPLVESSGKAPRARPKNLLKSTIRNAGMSLACITNPSSADSHALLHAAMQLGAEIARQKPATRRIPAFTKAVSCSEISALPRRQLCRRREN